MIKLKENKIFPETVFRGVPQGCFLGQLLFPVYLKDIPRGYQVIEPYRFGDKHLFKKKKKKKKKKKLIYSMVTHYKQETTYIYIIKEDPR